MVEGGGGLPAGALADVLLQLPPPDRPAPYGQIAEAVRNPGIDLLLFELRRRGWAARRMIGGRSHWCATEAGLAALHEGVHP